MKNLNNLNKKIIEVHSELLGYLDYYELDDSYEIIDIGYGRIILPKNSNGEIETLHVLPQIGIDVPEELSNYYNLENIQKFEETLVAEQNRDIGLGGLLNMLTEEIKKQKSRVAYSYFRIHRSIADINRGDRDYQFNIAHSGYSLLKSDIDKEELGQMIIDPYISELRKFMNENPIKNVIHHHSYDKQNPGNRYGGTKHKTGNERSPFMIFNEINTEIGYDIEGEVIGEMYTQEEIQIIKQKINNNFKKEFNIDSAVGVDDAFKMTASCLPAITASDEFMGVKTHVYEIRKDFLKGKEKADKTHRIILDYINLITKNDN